MRLIAVLISLLALATILGSASLVISKDYSPQLAVSVEGVPGYVYYNRPYDLTIKYANHGGDTKDAVELTAVLPPGFSLLGREGGISVREQSLVWQIGQLKAGESGEVHLTIKGTTPQDLTGAVYDLQGYEGHTAFEEGFELRVTLRSGTTTIRTLKVADTGVDSVANVSITKNDSPDPVVAGSNITYSLTVANGGPATAFTVQLSDTLPANTTFVSFTAPAGWTSVTPAVGGTGTVTSSIASMANGASANFTLVVNVNAGTPGGTVISNTATAFSASSPDPDDQNPPGNNSDTETTAVTAAPSADLSIVKTASPNLVQSGGNSTYTWTVTNNGPDSTTATMQEVIPAGLTFAGFVSLSAGVCIFNGGPATIDCDFGVLTPGSSATLQAVLTATAANGNAVVNTATTTGGAGDPNPGNNSASHTLLVGDAGTIVIELDTNPEPDATDFAFLDNIPACDIGSLDDDANGTLPNSVTCPTVAGSYVVTQQVGAGFNLEIVCTDPDNGTFISAQTAHLDLDPGETVSCIFRNSRSETPLIPASTATPRPTSTPIPTSTAAPTQTQAPTGSVGSIQPPATGDAGVTEGGNAALFALGFSLLATTLVLGIGLGVLRRKT